MDSRIAASPDDQAIGRRARHIRKRRGLSLDAAAGLAGVTKSYLSKLELGERRLIRRGLIEDLAQALSCSVGDLTGQPYLPVDRRTATAMAAVPAVSAALFDSTLQDVPDVPARSVDDLALDAARVLALADDVRFDVAGNGLGALITELHVQAATGDADTRRRALAALVEACIAARALAGTVGQAESWPSRPLDAATRPLGSWNDPISSD